MYWKPRSRKSLHAGALERAVKPVFFLHRSRLGNQGREKWFSASPVSAIFRNKKQTMSTRECLESHTVCHTGLHPLTLQCLGLMNHARMSMSSAFSGSLACFLPCFHAAMVKTNPSEVLGLAEKCPAWGEQRGCRTRPFLELLLHFHPRCCCSWCWLVQRDGRSTWLKIQLLSLEGLVSLLADGQRRDWLDNQGVTGATQPTTGMFPCGLVSWCPAKRTPHSWVGIAQLEEEG